MQHFIKHIYVKKKKQQKRSYKYVSYTETRATQLPSFFFYFLQMILFK